MRCAVIWRMPLYAQSFVSACGSISHIHIALLMTVFGIQLAPQKRFGYSNLIVNVSFNLHIIWYFLFWLLNQITLCLKGKNLAFSFISYLYTVHVSIESSYIYEVYHFSIKLLLLLLSQTEMNFSIFIYRLSNVLPSQSHNHLRAWIFYSF